MKFVIDIEDVPEEIEAKNYDEARSKLNELISIQEAEE